MSDEIRIEDLKGEPDPLMEQYLLEDCQRIILCPYCGNTFGSKELQSCCGEMHLTDGHLDTITGETLLYYSEYEQGLELYILRQKEGEGES